ncbi:NAD(P)/FAD-dependent oxidoreductase [Akkermansiaceae bacterium]|nr:NAD(P)/FAD-dependent oxidoreductase [Akkermansiaceae bacterium]MDA7888815.1 NAD(P)/FAD-dependent oxidoreductase [Akkermansiaceae bacterium]MDB4537240.1 NAD(P)/FAD-dependent oxidoreductase [Akkermansiaceae bacterium]
MSKEFDLVVIGGGSGGYAAAKTAIGHGLKVAVVEGADELGGLCILRGCMPTKALLETSNRLRAIREAAEFGIHVAEPSLDLEALRNRKTKLIDGFKEYRVKGLEKGDFELIRGNATFTSPHTIEVEGHGEVSAKAFIIATGSDERIPPVPGLKESPFWTSDDIVQMPSVPKKVVVVGTGAVGMESAHLFQGLGSDVSIISRRKPLVSSVEPAVSEAMEKRCTDLGINLVFGEGLQEVAHDASGFTLTLSEGTVIHCDQLIMATGRAPRIAGLNLEQAGFDAGLRRIEIDKFSQTSVPHIFAAGDCASPLAVVHLAVMQGEAAGANVASLLSEKPLEATWDSRLDMFGIFTDPEIVQVGLTHAQAREAGFDAVSAEYRFDDQGKGEIVGEKHGLVMLVADKKTGEILGASGMGPHVIDYAHTITVAMSQRLTVADFLKIPSYHPTLGEIWTYVAEELEDELS